MRTLTLSNNELKIGIRTLGAELCSLIDREDGTEHMWQADERFWPRHAPILFPTIGESKNGQVVIDSTAYPMGRHGFARHQPFTVIEQKAGAVTLELTETDASRQHFPFSFRFRVIYELVGNSLQQRFTVVNTDTSSFHFQLGGHPAFAVPFGGHGAFDDYEVVFDHDLTLRRHLLNDDGLYTGETRSFINNTDRFSLFYDLFNEDALVFRNIPAKRVAIVHQEGGKRLQMDFEDFPNFGIWSVPGADYVCLEPWIGAADNYDFKGEMGDKSHAVRLKPTQQFNATFCISLTR